MKKPLFSALLIGASLSLTQSLEAASNPASTDYVKEHISQAVEGMTASFQQEINTLLVQMKAQRIQTHQVGEHYQGGVIFFVDDSGLHGLIAAQKDANLGQAITWQNGESGDRVTNARANGLYAGLLNTQLIIAEQTIDDQEGFGFAALSATQFGVQADGVSDCVEDRPCYGNWYLPSISELALLKTNLSLQGLSDFSAGPYWSSTENAVNEAWVINLQTGEKGLTDKANTGLVRAIRSF